MNHKSLIILYPLLFLLMVALPIFNRMVDPLNLYIRTIPRIEQDQLLLVPENYNYRTLLGDFIKDTTKHDGVIMGGSKIINIITEDDYLNAGVTSASVYDFKKIWEILRKEDKIPRRVFVFIDQSNFTLSNHWFGISEQLSYLFSAKTLALSIGVFSNGVQEFQVIKKNDYNGSRPARDSHLSMIYPYAFEMLDGEKTSEKADSYGDGVIKELVGGIDKQAFSVFLNLIKEMMETSDVCVVILPYNPIVLNRLNDNDSAKSQLENFKLLISKSLSNLGIKFINGLELKYGNEDFSDGVHMKWKKNSEFFKQKVEDSL